MFDWWPNVQHRQVASFFFSTSGVLCVFGGTLPGRHGVLVCKELFVFGHLGTSMNRNLAAYKHHNMV